MADFLGDIQSLAERVGYGDAWAAPQVNASELKLERIKDQRSLKHFLLSYQKFILVPHELPAIKRASEHASRNEFRELMALDRSLAEEPLLKLFAGPSKWMGSCQLKKLRPIKDHRVIKRYLKAIEEGNAHGWHTLVYGLILALFSLPLRQGLMAYHRQVVNGFIHAAAGNIHLTHQQIVSLEQDQLSDLASATNQVLTETDDSSKLLII